MDTVSFSCGRLLAVSLAVSELSESVVAVLANIAAVGAAMSVANGCSYWLSLGDPSNTN